ncbi:MAG: type I-C CRISPR-associated protein Cas8c/Csd1 [Desulfurivibrionaceae bacterium]|jgi:CRISPR-associated protein Csd1
MILHALNQYYERLCDDPVSAIPLLGFGAQKIHFALVIDSNGTLVQGPVDLRNREGRRLTPMALIVPEAVKRTAGVAANFLWDNTGYVLGADNKDSPERALQCFAAFKELQHAVGDSLDDEGMMAVLRFLDAWNPENATGLPFWEEMAGQNVVFQLDGENRYIHERPAIRAVWRAYSQQHGSEITAPCLVTGEVSPVARLHPAIKGVRGAQSSGAAIVSFNLSAFESYGKKQSFNAPVSENVAFAYTTALNHLLRFDSRQKVLTGDTTFVFWAERETPVEHFLGNVFGDTAEPSDDPADAKAVRDFLEAARDGKRLPAIDPDVRFHILGLSPNAARLSVRFWLLSSTGEISKNVGQHFRDLAIERQFDFDPKYPNLWRLLRETALQGKSENIQPLLGGAVARAVFTGEPYPQSLLAAVIKRIRVDHNINYLRAVFIKACLVRKFRLTQQNPMEVKMALNKESTNVAYRLGRLFAALEKVQRDALPGINTTIRDRYYGSASATPKTVFPQLIRLAQHHIQKSEYGRVSDKNIEEILQEVAEFPSHLSLDQQGLFALGYYQQRQALYPKSEKSE